MEDLISRQAALDAVGKIRTPSKIKGKIEELPAISISVVEKAGKWEKMTLVYELMTGKYIKLPFTKDDAKLGNAPIYKCSECGGCVKNKPTNYCPNCGARMKGGQNESSF